MISTFEEARSLLAQATGRKVKSYGSADEFKFYLFTEPMGAVLQAGEIVNYSVDKRSGDITPMSPVFAMNLWDRMLNAPTKFGEWPKEPPEEEDEDLAENLPLGEVKLAPSSF